MRKEKPIEILREARNQIDQVIDKLQERPDINKTDYNREHELGTQYMFSNGAVFKYGRVDFGIIGYDSGEEMRYIWYRWFAMNGMAKSTRHLL